MRSCSVEVGRKVDITKIYSMSNQLNKQSRFVTHIFCKEYLTNEIEWKKVKQIPARKYIKTNKKIKRGGMNKNDLSSCDLRGRSWTEGLISLFFALRVLSPLPSL